MTRRERWKNAAEVLGIVWLILGGIALLVGGPVLLAREYGDWAGVAAVLAIGSLWALAAGYFFIED